MKKRKILVVASHPDDEILGCGGSMARWTSEGHEVAVLLISSGIAARQGENDVPGQLTRLHQAAREANAVLGVKQVDILNFPDNRLDSVPLLDIVQKIEDLIRKFQPHWVCTHHGGDLNVDHQKTAEAVMTSCRPLPGSQLHKILMFEVPSSTEWQDNSCRPAFVPNYFVGLGSHLEKKLQALEKYHMEMRPWPHARSLEAVRHLGHWRGASVGTEAAEAFHLARELDFS